MTFTLDRTPPAVGSIWRERRRMYHLRTVVVVETCEPFTNGFVKIRTLTREGTGEAVDHSNRKPSEVRLNLWHGSWEPA